LSPFLKGSWSPRFIGIEGFILHTPPRRIAGVPLLLKKEDNICCLPFSKGVGIPAPQYCGATGG